MRCVRDFIVVADMCNDKADAPVSPKSARRENLMVRQCVAMYGCVATEATGEVLFSVGQHCAVTQELTEEPNIQFESQS